MTCEISAFIVHKLIRTGEEKRLEKEEGGALLETNDSIQRLMDTLNQRYVDQGGRTFGNFSEDQDNFPISRYLDEVDIVNDQSQFYELSIRILDHLVAKARNTSATEGWVVMCLYKYNNNLSLSVAVVNEITGASIDETFQVKPSVYIDLTKLRHAGRINLTQWKGSKDKYVSFIRAARESTYFKEFLGCEYTNSNVEESNKLISAINAYAESENLNYEARNELTSKAFDFLQSASKGNTPIFLEHLANHLSPEEPEKLRSYLVSDDFKINDGFIPDGRTLKKLVEIQSKTPYWNLKLAREAFRHGVDYNIERGQLIIDITDPVEKEKFAKEVQGIDDHEPD
ncbi:nucleoid-associated protein [Acinetobacter bereziniae]|uniref:nucleoid-associated protein n=1 Tax=Acinetobacter bereziniae TaxID=106648 RepID=UPI0018FFD088|nr:nucleoid-associated protein [Acinetobacter bereziniae]MBJ9904520.1 nucleoid-associated protein [Acinetobacter bereziniae]MCU4320141.1 nucleoid-associated protein [Acinetobacter bereziniae]MCU4600302.1 nucleoid-associated protein [Acinetobacter bereziniae]